jgi:hypothetical protein
MRILVYTACFGEKYNTIPSLPHNKKHIDYLVYSDQYPSNIETSNAVDYWIYIPKTTFDSRKLSRIPKLNPALIIDSKHPLSWATTGEDREINIDIQRYTHLVWIDANCNIHSEDDLMNLCKKIPSGSWGLYEHPDRNCAYKERTCVQGLNYVNRDVLNAQFDLYKSRRFPKLYGLYACGIIIRSIESICTHRKLWDFWLDEFLRWTPRDQVCLPYCLFEMPQLTPISIGIFKYQNQIYSFTKRK